MAPGTAAPDPTDAAVASAYDELPLWAAPFGLALLEAVRLVPGARVLDVGFGTGFPLLELAQRLGPSSRLWGVDPWAAGNRRAAEKMRTFGLANVLLVRAEAEHLPLRPASIDLVVSNNGLNNVQDLEAALAECRRVCKPGAQMVLTFNLPETMRAFYDVYASVLRDSGLEAAVADLDRHVHAKRKPLAEFQGLVEAAGFAVVRTIPGSFSLRFLDGTALFAHHFVRLGFLPSWQAVPPPAARSAVMERLRHRLDEEAGIRGELKLDIPFACLDCRA
jgi:arsenite methyltransferase